MIKRTPSTIWAKELRTFTKPTTKYIIKSTSAYGAELEGLMALMGSLSPDLRRTSPLKLKELL